MNLARKVLSLLSVAALVTAMALPAAAAKAPAQPTPAMGAQPAAAAPAPPEKHPHIREALASLRASKEDLQHAAHDFGGHRVEAIRAIDEAIHQVEVCLQYDKD